MIRTRLFAVAAACGSMMLVPTAALAQAVQVDPNLPSYEPTSGVSGTLNSVGSDTLNNLMAAWTEKFRRYYPNVQTQVEGKGSSTAPPALIEGVSQLGPMSRKMKSKESDAFTEKFGFEPTRVSVAIDGLAVFVQKDNPIQSLTLEQLDAIFSSTRKRGYPTDIATWGAAGLTGDWANRPISIYGRNSASGTYGFFKEHTLKKGDYKDTVKEQPGSAAVVQSVTTDKYGIGYSGIGYKTSGVRIVPLAEKAGAEVYEATPDNVVNGTYPLARDLYIYFIQDPTKGTDKLVSEFLKFVLSKEGQEIVIQDGYMPLDAAKAEKNRSRL